MKKITATAMAKKSHQVISDMPPEWHECLGDIEPHFMAIIWGPSGNGKSSFVMQLVKLLAIRYKTLYVALEESFGISLKKNMERSGIDEDSELKLWFANHETNYKQLVDTLKKKQSPQVIIIDSVQYLDISYIDYKHLKTMFPSKAFIFISHAKGKLPDGKTADKIRYDAGVKIRIEGFMAFVTSRYGGTKNFVVWPEGAKKHWGKKFKSIQSRV